MEHVETDAHHHRQPLAQIREGASVEADQIEPDFLDGIRVVVFDTARKYVLDLIPSGAEILNSPSRTLELIDRAEQIEHLTNEATPHRSIWSRSTPHRSTLDQTLMKALHYRYI